MPKLNLLPWREQRRQQKNNQFIMALVLSLAITLLMAAAVWGYLQQINHTLILANKVLIDKNAQLQIAIDKDQSEKQRQQKIVAQFIETERLAHHRNSLVQLWSELTSVIPTTMSLTNIESQQGSMVFRGKSRESSAVSKFVAYLQQNPAIQQAQVKHIKKPESVTQATPYHSDHNQSSVDQQIGASLIDSRADSHHFDFEVVAILFEKEAKHNDSVPNNSSNEAASKEAGS
ncbi:PilN domain-containing protein [Psychrobacter sp. UBA3962]|uniref:PilN domain-containing protein n=1 Tax=Psychrobacter sp. UBA3962 TaxID=1947352 RepID=UPI0025D62DE2|nr:PilN domain-containing protein [Psychrobacter sp. UBA3962]